LVSAKSIKTGQDREFRHKLNIEQVERRERERAERERESTRVDFSTGSIQFCTIVQNNSIQCTIVHTVVQTT
jgi:exonuclease V gamma subunit